MDMYTDKGKLKQEIQKGREEFQESIITDSERHKTKLLCNFIIHLSANHYGVPEDYNSARSRKRELVLARQTAMWLMKKCTKLSLEKIGGYFTSMMVDGKRRSKDHATVIHAERTINNLMDVDKVFRKDMLHLLSVVQQKHKIFSQEEGFEQNFYFIDLDNFFSVKFENGKSIIMTGFTEEEIESMYSNEPHTIREHRNTSMYILERNNNEE